MQPANIKHQTSYSKHNPSKHTNVLQSVPQNHAHCVFGLLRIVRLSNIIISTITLKLMQKLVLRLRYDQNNFWLKTVQNDKKLGTRVNSEFYFVTEVDICKTFLSRISKISFMMFWLLTLIKSFSLPFKAPALHSHQFGCFGPHFFRCLMP